MKDWNAIIEQNWDRCIEAMEAAAHEVGDSDGESELRVELNEDGRIDTYWTFSNITSAEVHNGTAITLGRYYGGDEWSEDWADSYDAAADLEARQRNPYVCFPC